MIDCKAVLGSKLAARAALSGALPPLRELARRLDILRSNGNQVGEVNLVTHTHTHTYTYLEREEPCAPFTVNTYC